MTFIVYWDTCYDSEAKYVNKKDNNRKIVAMAVRSITEAMLATHFGDTFIDKLFERYVVHAYDHLSMEKTMNFNIVISLTRNSEMA